MSIEKNITEPEHLGKNSLELRENRAREIAFAYQISFEKSKELINSTSIQSLSELQKEFVHLDSSRLQDLINEVEKAKHNISSLSKNEISSLIEEMVSTETEMCDISILEKTFGTKRIHNAMNPQNTLHHIDGGFMGAGNSCINTIKCITSIGKGIINTPRDLFLWGTGQAEYRKDV